VKNFLTIQSAGAAALALMVQVLLTGCSGTPRWGAWSVHPSPVRLASVLGTKDSYLYYPAYQVYYNRTKQQFVFPSDRGWTTQEESPGDVGEADLFSSPSVAMNFTDAPQGHHAAMVRAYPRNWGRPHTLTASAQ